LQVQTKASPNKVQLIASRAAGKRMRKVIDSGLQCDGQLLAQLFSDLHP
jgi:hypothetical protein